MRLCSRTRSPVDVTGFLLGVAMCWLLLSYSTRFYGNSRAAPLVPHHVSSPTSSPTSWNTTTAPGRHTSLLQPSDGFIVPNIVHFVWYGLDEPFKFHHLLSLRSVLRYVQPDHIYLHCDHPPVGHLWGQARALARKRLTTVRSDPPTLVFGREVVRPQHQRTLTSISVLLKAGGIYLELDVIALKSFDPLRRYEFTMGVEYHGHPGRLNNGVIVAKSGARFLREWYATWRNFTKSEWDEHEAVIPYRMQYDRPQLIHVEETALQAPGGRRLDQIYSGHWDWRTNYSLHLWRAAHGVDYSEREMRAMNSTLGEVARHVLKNATAPSPVPRGTELLS